MSGRILKLMLISTKLVEISVIYLIVLETHRLTIMGQI